MTPRRFTAPLGVSLAAALMLLATPPAQAQDYPFQGFAVSEAIGTLQASVLAASLPDSDEDDASPSPRRRPSVPGAARSGPAPAENMRFSRDPAVTRQVQADLVRMVSRSAPDAGRALAVSLQQGDPLTHAAPVFRRYGLGTDNVLDAVAIYYLAMWGAANNQNTTMTRDQARGARAHVARAVDFDRMDLPSAAARQRFAETLIYQGLLMDAAIEQAQASDDQAMQRALSDGAHRQMVRLGLDMRRLAVTGDGFVPR